MMKTIRIQLKSIITYESNVLGRSVKIAAQNGFSQKSLNLSW